jgi:hypothetical protein
MLQDIFRMTAMLLFYGLQKGAITDILDIRASPWLAVSIGPNWVGFYLRTETESSLRNVFK